MHAKVNALLSRETLLLLAICLFDTVSSAWLFHHHAAVEANPILRGPAEAGMLPFVSAKLLTFIPALLAAEWYRRRRPEFVQPLLRCAGVAYATVYGAAVLGQLFG
jgi:hypothetical protein